MTDLRKLADELKEASRYVHGNPDVTKQAIGPVIEALASVYWQHLHGHGDRLAGNLRFARDHMLAEPDVSRGYILGAATEIQMIAERTR